MPQFMNLQIFGTKQCKNTKKAEMFFKERRISYHLVNLAEKPMSKGELQSVLSAVPAENLLDTESKAYKSQNLQYMKFDVVSKLLENPALFKTPIIRNGKKATAGFEPDTWKKWLEESA